MTQQRRSCFGVRVDVVAIRPGTAAPGQKRWGGRPFPSVGRPPHPPRRGRPRAFLAQSVAEAEAAIERLAAAPADEGLVNRDVWLLRLRALLARAYGDVAAYAQFRDRYREMARSLGFEGHIAWAEAMP